MPEAEPLGNSIRFRVDLPHTLGTTEAALERLKSAGVEGVKLKLERVEAKLSGEVYGYDCSLVVLASPTGIAVEVTADKPWIVPQALIENRVHAALVAALR
jgi:hypothetical protein